MAKTMASQFSMHEKYNVEPADKGRKEKESREDIIKGTLTMFGHKY